MKVAFGQISHETNTFSSIGTSRESFEAQEWARGALMLERHEGVEDFLGGMMDRARELGWQTVGTFSATTSPSGTITAAAYRDLKENLVEGLSDAGDADAVCLALHGAGVAEGTDDLEGEVLAAVRQEIGRSKPLVATLDLHGNLTRKMLREADLLLGVKLYPHVDLHDRGMAAVEAARRILDGVLRPAMHLATLPLLVPTSTTDLPPARDANALCAGWEAVPDLTDCTFFHGFPYADTPRSGVSVLATTNGDGGLARRAAEDVARGIWGMREAFFSDHPSPEEGIRRALGVSGRPVIVNETSDNPGAGAPGDGTRLLAAMLAADLENACFAFICDPEVTGTCHEAGEGSVVSVALGGKTDALHGVPVKVRARVERLSNGRFTRSSPMGRGTPTDLGSCARLRVGGLDVIVTSVRGQVLDEQIFVLHGIDIVERDVVGIKSSQHFRAALGPVSAGIVTVDSPGISTSRLGDLPYGRIARPVYPLDPGTDLEPGGRDSS